MVGRDGGIGYVTNAVGPFAETMCASGGSRTGNVARVLFTDDIQISTVMGPGMYGPHVPISSPCPNPNAGGFLPLLAQISDLNSRNL